MTPSPAPETPGTLEIVGIPMDLGQTLRGVDLGPGALRYAGLRTHLRDLGFDLIDHGNLPVPVRDSLPAEERSNYLPAVQEVCGAAYKAARNVAERGHGGIFLGGDHSIAIGTVGGMGHVEPVGLLYLDAHGDCNTPVSTPSGNIHGMPLAVLLGEGYPELVDIGRPGPKLAPEDVVLLGVREVDPEERRHLAALGITVYTMRDIDERGMGTVAREALDRLGHRPRLHVSLDLDVLDPMEAPGVGTAVPGGLTYREAMLLCEIVADSRRLVGLDLVEINPILDHENSTARRAVELTATLFGKSIL